MKPTVKRVLRRGLQAAGLVVAGLLVALAAIAFVDHEDAPWMPPDRWLLWAPWTVLVFWGVGGEFRHARPRMALWISLAGLAVVHIAAWALVLDAIPDWRSIWFAPCSLAEYAAFTVILHRLALGRSVTPHRKNQR